MDGSVRARAVPTGYVYVRVCTCLFCMSAEETAQNAPPPSAPPPVCALPSRQPYVKCPLRVLAHVAAEFT